MGSKGSKKKKKGGKGGKDEPPKKKVDPCIVSGCCPTQKCQKIKFYSLKIELTFSLNKYLSGVLTEVTGNEMTPTKKKKMLKRMKKSKHPRFLINCPHKAEYLKCYQDALCPPEQKQFMLGGDYAL